MTDTAQREKLVFARSVKAKTDGLEIRMPDGVYFVRWDDCPVSLREASEAQRKNLALSPSGYGAHWFDLDEDISVRGLLQNAARVR